MYNQITLEGFITRTKKSAGSKFREVLPRLKQLWSDGKTNVQM